MRLTSCRSEAHANRRRSRFAAAHLVAVVTATAIALTVTAAAAHAAATDTHVVARGDSLWRIAAAALPQGATDARTALTVARIAALNARDLPDGPDHLVSGQRLRMPRKTFLRVRSRAALGLGAGYERPDGSERVRDVQRTLRKRGFRPGPVDGLFGPRTQGAVLRFQRAAGLVANGVAGERTNAKLHRRERVAASPGVIELEEPTAPPVMADTQPQAPKVVVQVLAVHDRGSAEPGGWLFALTVGLWVLGVMALLVSRFRGRGAGRTPDAAARAGMSANDGRHPPCSLAAGQALTVQPYETSVMNAIEHAILASDIVPRGRVPRPVDPPAPTTERPLPLARQRARVGARAYLSEETARSAPHTLPVEVELVVETSDFQRRTTRVGERGRQFSVPSTDVEGAVERLVRTNREVRERLTAMGVEEVEEVALQVELTPALAAAARQKTADCS